MFELFISNDFNELAFFYERIDFAIRNGIKRENLIIDPGIGFGKNLNHNLEILKNMQVE